MAEVLLATGQLLAALQAEASGANAGRRDTLETLLGALEVLAGQVDAEPGVGGPRTPTMVREAACALAERYNAHLELVVETCADPIVARLFSRIDIGEAREEDTAGAGMLSALSADTASLVAYLRKLVARADGGSGIRGKMWDGDSKPALAG